jgi:hypothetical protein
MKTATTKQVRAIVRNYYNGTIGTTWTDKVKGDETARRVAFNIGYNSMTREQRERVRVELQAFFMMAGYDNVVRVTDSTGRRTGLSLFCRDDAGCYIRVNARIG